MNITILIWLGAFAACICLMLRRASWAIPAYLMTVYTNPNFWWFGDVLRRFSIRWNLMAGLALALAVLLDKRPISSESKKLAYPVAAYYFLFCLNATLVHYLFADNPENSAYGLQLSWKHLCLLVCLIFAIRDRFDLQIFFWSIATLAGYVGYEIVFNYEGSYEDGRLNGISIMQATEANELSGLFCISTCCAGYLVFYGRNWLQKGVALTLTALSFEVVLRCVSRAAFLSLLLGGGWFLLTSKGRSRRNAALAAGLAVVAAFVMMGKEHQANALGRFSTSFAAEEERDGSAQSRLEYWITGLDMIQDHPLGSGYEAAFSSDLGLSYLSKIGKSHKWYTTYRSVHNGFIDVAASWGVQGLFLLLLTIWLARRRLRAGILQAEQIGDDSSAFMGYCLDAIIVTQFVVAVFSSTLDSEWFLWWVAMATTFARGVITAPYVANYAIQPHRHLSEV